MKHRYDRDHLLSFGRFLWQRFVDDKCFETAGALSYTTLVSLVPLSVAVLAVFSAFPSFHGARETLLGFVFRNFVPAAGETVREALLAFAANASKLTSISILVMLASVLSMMVSIEDRLNRIWRVRQPRSWVSRLLLYWAALTLGPILAVGGIALASFATAVPLLQVSAGHWVSAGQRLLALLPFVATFGMLWLMFVLVPNCRVSRRNAALGAFLGALLFEVARWGFALFVRHAQNYQDIYGALAVIPVFLLWIYLSWVIVILAASIAASVAAFDYQRPDEVLPEGAEFLGLLVVLRHFVEAQRRGEGVEVDGLCRAESRLCGARVLAYFDELQNTGLIQRGDNGWLLSRSLDSTDLLRLYQQGRYRLPLQPRDMARELGLHLPEALLAMLAELGAALQAGLGHTLTQIYPLPAPSNEISA